MSQEEKAEVSDELSWSQRTKSYSTYLVSKGDTIVACLSSWKTVNIT